MLYSFALTNSGKNVFGVSKNNKNNYTFIQQWHIESNCKDINNANFYIKYIYFFSLLFIKVFLKNVMGFHKNIKQHNHFQHWL